MDEADQVSQFIGDIYDAALDPKRWPHVLERTCAYVGGAVRCLRAPQAVLHT
jgi:hypothetical protein